jgi:hypothetical protein
VLFLVFRRAHNKSKCFPFLAPLYNAKDPLMIQPLVPKNHSCFSAFAPEPFDVSLIASAMSEPKFGTFLQAHSSAFSSPILTLFPLCWVIVIWH